MNHWSKTTAYYLKKLSLPVVCLMLMPRMESYSQSKKAMKLFDEAQQYYRMKEAANALTKLETAIKLAPDWADLYLLRADIFADIDSLQLQINSLKQALRLNPDLPPNVSFILGNACYKQGEYCEAKEAFEQFLSSGKAGNKEPAAREMINACVFASRLVANEVPFVAENLGDSINTEYSEYWPSLTVDEQKLVFTRLVPVEKQMHPLMPRYQEDFYQAEFKDSIWRKAKSLAEINTPDNEGAQSISADGKLIFFSACNRSDGFGSCDIYFSRWINGKWTTPQNAGSPVSTSSWDSQPSISADGSCLFFVSNRPGTKGGKDLWRCCLVGFNEQNKPIWGNVENLGDSVNTRGNEVSPYIHPDSRTLYFASDSWPGLGGTDIFIIRQNADSTWSSPINLGYPINSANDEQGLIVDSEGEYAYYSSNRNESRGMDIYRFRLFDAIKPIPVSYVKGIAFDKTTGRPIQADIDLTALVGNKKITTTRSSLEKGEFLLALPMGESYAFHVQAPGYLFYSDNFALKEEKKRVNPFLLEIGLEPIQAGEIAVLQNIFFEFDSDKLKEESIIELIKIKSFLIQNPKVSIEIGGHTDNSGTEQYNLTLSEKRAKAVVDYLISTGINSGRLSFRGYGFSVPVGDNNTEEGRAQNRRTEFKITEVN